jgi:hypothetical protein
MLSPRHWTRAVVGALAVMLFAVPAAQALTEQTGGPRVIGATPHRLLATFDQASNSEQPGFLQTLGARTTSRKVSQACWPTAIGAYLPNGTAVGQQTFNEDQFRNEWRYHGQLIIWDGERFISRARKSITVAVWCARADAAPTFTNLD